MPAGMPNGKTLPHDDVRPHVVYELWLKGECVYVGMTVNVERRIKEHRRQRSYMAWDEVCTTSVSSRLSAEGLEARLISLLRPKHNWRWNPDHDKTLLPRGGFFALHQQAAWP